MTEQQTAINHQNNNDIWLVGHKADSDKFIFFLFTKNGMLCCPKSLGVGVDYSKLSGNMIPGRIIKISPDGTKLCATTSADPISMEFFHMEWENASLRDNEYFEIAESPLSIEFSVSGNFLYAISSEVYQFNTTHYDSRISTSKKRIEFSSAFNGFDGQLGHDGKLYVANLNSKYLAVILHPDSSGFKSQFVEKGVSLNGRKSRAGLPNFNSSYFYTPSIDFAYTEDCWLHKYEFEGRDTIKANTWKWIFQKDSYRDSLLTKHCVYQFLDTGKWQVSHYASNGTRTDTVTKTLTIRTKWQKDLLGKDTFYCAGDSIKLTLKAPTNMHCVHWMGEEPNLDKTLGPIVNYNHFHVDSIVVDTAGAYIVKLTNKAFCQMRDTINVVEGKIPLKPSINILSQTLTSTIKADKYRWFLNDTILIETKDGTIKPARNGYYQVILISEYNCESPPSDSFLYDKISVKNYNFEKINIYPNPSDGKITIAFEQPLSCNIEVFDMTGKRVAKKIIEHKTETTLQIKKPGSYVVKVGFDNRAVEKVIEVL